MSRLPGCDEEVWRYLPDYYRVADGPVDVAAAFRYCETLARRHYENFTVVSAFLPRRLRPHMFSVYAYCRWADDLSDEIPDPARAEALLRWWGEELEACYAGGQRLPPGRCHPVFVALAETVREFEIPIEPFQNLLRAFLQDQHVRRYETYDDLREYCRYSADPVGRLVLYLFGYRDAERQALSDCTCTALQLANFWQDVTVDWGKGRVYLPLEDLRRFGYTEEALSRGECNGAFRALMAFEVARARELFAAGAALKERVAPRLRIDLELFTRGGLEILRLIERADYDVLTRRPALSGGRKAALILRRLLSGVRAMGDPR
jgi:squalene synthase HpnC